MTEIQERELVLRLATIIARALAVRADVREPILRLILAQTAAERMVIMAKQGGTLDTLARNVSEIEVGPLFYDI